MKNPLQDLAHNAVPESIDLWPDISAKLSETKSLMQTLRARPALALALALLALLLLSGVAYAIGRLTGYIPGVGLIDKGEPIRVLAEPVIQTRDGITLTVTSAVLTSDKTVINFTLENVPWAALSHQENVLGCTGMAEVHLPDGASLQFSEGGAGSGQNHLVYSAIPSSVDNATLILPCISETLPGKAPENWQLSLHFVPAPPDMTIVPVIEIQPSPTSQTNPVSAQASPLSITKVMDIGDNYVIFGEFNAEKTKDALHPDARWQLTEGIKLSDGNGQDVYAETPSDIEIPTPTAPDTEVWAYRISKNFTPPLTISYPGIYITNVGAPQSFEFDFDSGEHPQPGQEWTLNKDFTLDGYTIQLASISVDSRGGGGYNFTFAAPPSTDLFAEHANALSIESVDIAGYSPIGGGGGSGGFTKTYEKLPTGKFKVVVIIQHLASGSKKDWQIQWSPENPSANASLYGITLKLDKFIPLDDGYYLIGRTEWNDERISRASPSGWAMKAYDAKGQEVPLEPADWQAAGLAPETNQWLYKIHGRNFNAPITLRATQMSVEFKQPVRMSLDLRPYGFEFVDNQFGTPWKTGLIPLDVPGILANAFKATYVKEGDQRGFEIAIQADPALQGLGFRIESGLDISGLSQISGGGGSNRDEATGLVLSTVLTNAKMSFPLVFRADGASVNGAWETLWSPPTTDANVTPMTVQQACVTLDKWKQATDNPVPVPAGLSDKVLISRGALSPDPSLFISKLDGSVEQPLVFGQGSLSPDGTNLVYSGADGHLGIMNVLTKQTQAFTNGFSDLRPLWSPDGTRIAFTRWAGNGPNIFIIDADGQNLRALTDTTENPTVIAWMPDGQKVVAVTAQQAGNLLQLIDIKTGDIENLFSESQSLDPGVSVSPDGQWIAFMDKVLGRMTSGIFISRLDGSEKRLLVQLDYWMVTNPVWSPDGKWLAFSVMNTDQLQPLPTPALLNAENCQVVPLTGLNGTIEQWVNH